MKKVTLAIYILITLSGCSDKNEIDYNSILKDYIIYGGTFHNMTGGRNLKFTDPNSIEYTNWKVKVFKDKSGLNGCVDLNSKNSFGGYTGYKPYMFYIENNEIIGMYQTSCSI